MPQSDTWPGASGGSGGSGLEVVPGIDSSGSCDSVLSTNSGCSDDSLEHLSAEEKACLMFLEETIDSLDTEDDSGLSNDEEEQASFNHSTSISEHKETQKQSINANAKKLPSYLVPTPFVLANSSHTSTGLSAASKRNFAIKPPRSISDQERSRTISPIAEAPPVPLEVNVIIPSKTQEPSVKAVDVALQRGPLSYNALFYLRKNASEKKTPLCPLVDHTIESAKESTKESVSTARENRPVQNSKISRFDRFHPEFSQSRTIPPAVPPKPKKKPENSNSKTALSSSRSFSVKRTPNPEMVRQEALHKLGLIKETDENAQALLTEGFHRGQDSARGKFAKSAGNNQAARSPSFCVTRLTETTKSKGLQCSASFHHSSRPEHSAVTLHHHHHHHHRHHQYHTSGPQHNQTNGPQHPVQSERGPQHPVQSERGPQHPVQSERGPQHPVQSERGPQHPVQSERGPQHPVQSERGPQHPVQSGRGPQHPVQSERGPQHPVQSERGPQHLVQSERGPQHPVQSERGPQHPVQAERGPQHPVQSERGPQHPVQSERGPQHPVQSERGPQHPVQSERGPQHPVQSERGPQHPVQSERGPQHPVQSERGPQHPVQSERGPQHPVQSERGPQHPVQSERGPQHPVQSERGPQHPVQSERGPQHPVQSERGPQHPVQSERGPQHPVQSERGPKDTALSKTPKASGAVGYTVMVVPGMGADRREALRKLGLLKD